MKYFGFHWFKTFVFAALMAVAFSAAPALASDEKEAVDYTVSIGNQALEILSSKTHAEAVKQEKLRDLFGRIVDTDWIARFVIGASWRKMSDAEQTDYLTTYRAFLIKHYTQNFSDYTEGTTFKVARVRKIGADGKQFLVSIIINRKGQQPVNLDYRIRKDDESLYRAIDILVEGVSLLATQRSEFNSVIQRDGVDRLISLLKKKAA